MFRKTEYSCESFFREHFVFMKIRYIPYIFSVKPININKKMFYNQTVQFNVNKHKYLNEVNHK